MLGILFDLDGTLLDTLGDLADGVNYALRLHGYPERTVQEVRRFVGNGAGRLFDLSVPQGEDPVPVLKTFQEYYPLHCQDKTRPYEGIPAALAALGKRFPLAIVSNKPDGPAKQLCAHFFPGIYALGESPLCPRKPAPDMVYRAMEAIGADACIYVGDSEVDVRTAGNAGVPCLSVTWGFRDHEELVQAGAAHLISRPEELEEEILKINELRSL